MLFCSQTKSKAASEVERFRKESSGEGKTETPPYLTRSSPLTPPPPPPISAPPPPPPPVFPQGKANTVGHLNANASMNPALAREALLEAIRSGSGAERLRKVIDSQALLRFRLTLFKLRTVKEYIWIYIYTELSS